MRRSSVKKLRTTEGKEGTAKQVTTTRFNTEGL